MSKQKSRKSRKQQQGKQNRMVLGLGLAMTVIVGLLIASASTGTGNLAADSTANTLVIRPDTDVTTISDADRLNLDPIMGDVDAPVTIIEYSAYGCEACRSWHRLNVVNDILAEFPGQVRFVQRDYPVISPAYDEMAANVAQCVLDQSIRNPADPYGRFWQFHDMLYSVVDVGASQTELVRLGVSLGMDGAELQACAEENRHRETVDYDERRARSVGLRGTPAFSSMGKTCMASTQRL